MVFGRTPDHQISICMASELIQGFKRKGFCIPWLQEAVEDTTGAGDAFIGTILYGVIHKLPHDKMLRLAALVAACKCTALGARPGLPHAHDIDADLLTA